MNLRALNAVLMAAAAVGGLVLVTNVDGYTLAPAVRFYLTVYVSSAPIICGFLPRPRWQRTPIPRG